MRRPEPPTFATPVPVGAPRFQRAACVKKCICAVPSHWEYLEAVAATEHAHSAEFGAIASLARLGGGARPQAGGASGFDYFDGHTATSDGHAAAPNGHGVQNGHGGGGVYYSPNGHGVPNGHGGGGVGHLPNGHFEHRAPFQARRVVCARR